MTRGRISWLLSAALLLGATAATAATLPCTSVSPEAREYVRSRGACRDPKPVPRPRASTQAKSSVSQSPTSAPEKLVVPDVIGRSYADAARALANFNVERVELANAAPTGEVLAQEPAPATPGHPGSTVILQVSDGSIVTAASTNPVTPAVTAAAASSTTAPATDLAPASTAAPTPPQEPAVPPGAGGQFPAALSANAALIFGAGVLLGLLSGALLMRGRLLRRQPAFGEYAAPPTLRQRQQPVDQQPVTQQPVTQQPVDQQPVTQQPVARQPVDQQRRSLSSRLLSSRSTQQPVDQQPVVQQPADQQPVAQQSADQQPADQQPAGSDAGGVSEPCAPSGIRFAARFVSAETTIVLAPFREPMKSRSTIRATTMHNQVRLHVPIEVTGDDVERALRRTEQGRICRCASLRATTRGRR